MRQILRVHGQREHRANGPDPIPVLLHVRVSATADDSRFFTITPDLSATYLRSAQAAVRAADAGDLELMVKNGATDMLADPIVIGAGDTNSYGSGTPSAPDTSGAPAANRVLLGDTIEIEIVSGSFVGLEVLLEFGPQIIRLTP